MSNNLDLSESIRVYCDFTLSDDQHSIALAGVTTQLAQKCLTIQELIVELGIHLTGQDEKLRGRATLLLAEVASALSFDPIAISSNSINQLSIFFRNRLSDFPSLLPSLRGLEVIITYHSGRVVPRDDFIRGMAKSLGEVNVQSLSQSYRTGAYRSEYTLSYIHPSSRPPVTLSIYPYICFSLH